MISVIKFYISKEAIINAYVTSIGERTTDICCEQLKRLGFDVFLLDEKEEWIVKYKKFIEIAIAPCVRVDADVIVNKNLKEYCETFVKHPIEDMTQFNVFDLYKNDLSNTSPLLYSEKAINKIRELSDKIDSKRPETSAWRLIQNECLEVYTSTQIMGIHGLLQDTETIKRAKQNKIDRKQIDNYDFDLVFKIKELYEKS